MVAWRTPDVWREGRHEGKIRDFWHFIGKWPAIPKDWDTKLMQEFGAGKEFRIWYNEPQAKGRPRFKEWFRGILPDDLYGEVM